jgi:tight adherence protein C
MAGAITLLLTFACLATGAMMLVHGLRDFSTTQLVTRRFREHVAPQQVRTGARDLMVRLGRNVAGSEPVGDLAGLLMQAGFMGAATPFLFVGARLVVSLVMAGGALVKPLLHGGIGARDAAFSFFVGFLVYRGCTIALKLRIEARQREIRRELPYVLDLLLMVLDAGVSIDQALQHVAGQVGDVAPVSALLLARYVAETEDGVPYDKALERLAERMAIAEGRDFAGLLKQNLYQGGELSQPLRRLATDIGEARLALAREQMGRKSVLLTLAMLLFFMPVLMIALAGPAVSDLVGTLSHVAHDLDNQRMKQ